MHWLNSAAILDARLMGRRAAQSPSSAPPRRMVSALELQVWLVEQELGEYCYINHIAVNYKRDDRPTGKGKFRRWLKQLSFLEEFQDGEGK